MINDYLNHYWPIDYKKSTNREETVRVTLKSLVFYVIFLIIATTGKIFLIVKYFILFNYFFNYFLFEFSFALNFI